MTSVFVTEVSVMAFRALAPVLAFVLGLALLVALPTPAHAQWTAGPAWFAEGNQGGCNFGVSPHSAGDVDGDGYGDLVVAAWAYDGPQTNEGRAYLFLGSRDGLAKVPAWTFENDQPFSYIGSVTGAGDVNGDGFDDVLVSSYLYNEGAHLGGRVLLFLGGSGGLATGSAWSLAGDVVNLNLGHAIAAAGDVDHDGLDDVLISATHYTSGHTNEGAVFLYLGTPQGLAATPAWQVEGNQTSSGFGGILDSADVNGDGWRDVLVGAGSYNHGENDEGAAFLFLGSPAGLSTEPDWMVEGNQAQAGLGLVSCAGDVNGDGLDDVLVGTPGHDIVPPPIGGAEGRADLYLGSAAGLSPVPVWTFLGTQRSELLGFVSPAGDVDADGFDDVLVAGPGFDGGGIDRANGGRVLLFFGSATGLRANPQWTVVGGRRNGEIGRSLAAAGDVNGDGFADFLLGSELYSNGQTREGLVWTYHGAPRTRIRDGR